MDNRNHLLSNSDIPDDMIDRVDVDSQYLAVLKKANAEHIATLEKTNAEYIKKVKEYMAAMEFMTALKKVKPGDRATVKKARLEYIAACKKAKSEYMVALKKSKKQGS